MSKTSQEQPTSTRPIDGQGREIDQWSLPINGPARLRALAAHGKPDPNTSPEAWAFMATDEEQPAPPPPVKSKKEANNG